MKKALSVILAILLTFSLASVSFAADYEKKFENSSYYEVGDYVLHYRIFEPVSEVKNQIILIHGFCLSTASLEGVAEEYSANGYRTVLVDVPNFGYSSREKSGMNLLSREELVASLMEFLGGTWIVGGHSMGGGIAINLAVSYPETVTGLVLFAPQTSNEISGITGTLLRSGAMQSVYNFILKFFLAFPSFVRSFVATSFSDEAFAKSYELSRVTDPLSVSGTGAGITIMSSHTKGTDFKALSQLQIPCVILTAENDNVADGNNLARIIENAPSGTVVYEVKSGGHMMMEYDPENAAALTLETIESCG